MSLNTPTTNTHWFKYASQTATSTAVTSASFTPAANALVVLVVTGQRNTAALDNRVVSVTSTNGMTFTRQAQCAWTGSAAATTGTHAGAGSANGGPSAEIWTATTGASPTAGTVTVNYPSSASTFADIDAEIVMFTDTSGSVPTFANATWYATTGTTSPNSFTLTTSAGSYIVVARADWSGGTIGTVGTGYTSLVNALENNDYDCTFMRSTSTTSAGSTTVSYTPSSGETSAGQTVAMVALEVTAPSSNVSGTAALTQSATLSTTGTLSGVVGLSQSVTLSAVPALVTSAGLSQTATLTTTPTLSALDPMLQSVVLSALPRLSALEAGSQTVALGAAPTLDNLLGLAQSVTLTAVPTLSALAPLTQSVTLHAVGTKVGGTTSTPVDDEIFLKHSKVIFGFQLIPIV